MKRMRHIGGWTVLLLAWLALSLSVAGLAQEPDQEKEQAKAEEKKDKKKKNGRTRSFKQEH